MNKNINLVDFDTISTQGRNDIFVSVKDGRMTFSSGSIKALENVPYVKVMTNVANHQLLLLKSDSGQGFMKPNKKNRIVIWTKTQILDTIKNMLPEGKKEGVRINGDKVEVMGEKGILFSCDNPSSMRFDYRSK